MDVAKQDFELANLPTKSVILFPSRARVVRSLENVSLKPGQNEIQIYGLTPTVDEHSIQVYGTGAATITDFTVELVPNRKVFEEEFPEFDKDDAADDSDDDMIEIEDCEQVKQLSVELEELDDESDRHTEIINSSARQLDTLDVYVRSLSAAKNGADEVEKTIAMYGRERARVFDLHCKAAEDLKIVKKLITEKQKAKEKAGIADRRRYEERIRVKNKEFQRKQAQKEKQQEELKRLKEEKLKFWPKKVFVVTVNLEVPLYTPSSSRRNSIDSVTLAAASIGENTKGKDASIISTDSIEISLSLAYVTRDASWSPRYDINIDSIKKSAAIAYRAELVNETSETWKDMQLVLSTSQTSYSGLEDKIPFMNPWHVKLNKHLGQELMSTEEMNYSRSSNSGRAQGNRSDMFGAESKRRSEIKASPGFASGPIPRKPVSNLFGGSVAPSSSKAIFGSSTGGGFMSSAAIPPPPPMANEMAEARTRERYDKEDDELEEDDMGFGLFDDDGSAPGKKELDYQESKWGDHGLTSTYELPGARSLVPSSIARRHKIASLQAANINLSHVLIAKLRPAAFLRAKIRNPSSTVTLLKGTAGITLDGSFIGNTALSRVSPGALFEMSLGVDPAVQVNYPKPTMQRSTGGLFNKELNQVFSRNIWITNSKILPIELTVLDQFPVSQDERLSINCLQPKGLSREGDVVRAGVAAKESASGVSETSKNNAWGKATATLRANGQVAWTVNLEKKQACLLKLEYEAKMPASERITAA